MLKVIFMLMFMMILPLISGNLMTLGLIFGFLMFVSMLFMGFINMEHLSVVVLGEELGGNMMSGGLGLLSVWIISLMFLASVVSVEAKENKYFSLLLLGTLILLLGVFMSIDLFMFYLAFEGVLIPTYILIIGWGYQPERLQAGLYLLFYTLIASLPLLIVILGLENYLGLGSVFYLTDLGVTGWGGMAMYFAGVLAFFVKMPLFMFHLWLPKAHVEAPISGSMLLAGVLLKMGGYGLFRISYYFYSFIKVWGTMWMSFGLMGGVYLSLVCLRQNDVKSLIAYSSVVHMGLVVAGLMTLKGVGLMGAYILMFGHGLCSSGLFCLANISYSKIHSRSLLLSSGMMSIMPSFSLMWFLLSSSNMAAPPSLNLLGEITLIGSIIGWGYQLLFVLIFLSFLSASYCLYLFSFSQHGTGVKIFGFYSVSVLDYLLIMMHWVPLNLLFCKGELFYL